MRRNQLEVRFPGGDSEESHAPVPQALGRDSPDASLRLCPEPEARVTTRCKPARAAVLIRRTKARYLSSKSGASAIEFALVAAILVTLVFGLIEFSLIFYTYTQAGTATRDVVRRIATGRLSTTSASDQVKAQLPAWVRNWATVTTSQTTPSNAATNQITVSVSFPAAKATPTTYLSFAYGSLTLTRSLTLPQEI